MKSLLLSFVLVVTTIWWLTIRPYAQQDRNEYVASISWVQHGDVTRSEYFELRFGPNGGSILVSGDRDVPFVKMLMQLDKKKAYINVTPREVVRLAR